ncbi:hypothetical protein [Hymenobacter koreensis]|uniref:DUF4397 domain-containing protein n=1 Tax=Hymenobacter koreensis TaxID=1084523 RepID=A0ABP8IVZ6_9BACT
MKNRLIRLFSLVLLATTAFSCEKEYDDKNLDPLAPSLAEIPVTVTNANYFERFPVIEVKGNSTPPPPPATTPVAAAPTVAAPGAFSITFSIPSDRGTIKEITRVATGNNGLTVIQTGAAAAQLNYNGNAAAPATVPVQGNGTNTITFTSSLLDFANYRTRVGTGAGLAPLYATNPRAPTQNLYYFLLTLNTPNGEVQVIPMAVRVRVVA